MRTITLNAAAPFFGDDEIGPPRYMLADAWNGTFKLVQTTHPEEGREAMRAAAALIVVQRKAANAKQVDIRNRNAQNTRD